MSSNADNQRAWRARHLEDRTLYTSLIMRALDELGFSDWLHACSGERDKVPSRVMVGPVHVITSGARMYFITRSARRAFRSRLVNETRKDRPTKRYRDAITYFNAETIYQVHKLNRRSQQLSTLLTTSTLKDASAQFMACVRAQEE